MSGAALTPRRLNCFLEGFIASLDKAPTPDKFKLWSAIACVSGALERRVWCEPLHKPLYPNEFIVLIARPGIGKSVPIARCVELWQQVRELRVAADDVSSASLLDELADASKEFWYQGRQTIYHSIQVGATEFGDFIPEWDSKFMNKLNKLYDCESKYRERKRGGTQHELQNVQISFIGGTTPSFIGEKIPMSAWEQGFPSRSIMVYSEEHVRPGLFQERTSNAMLESHLIHDLMQISRLSGPFDFTPEAAEAIVAWYNERLAPEPKHIKLVGYNTRRFAHVMKLTMIVTAARGNDLLITAENFAYAKEILLDVESVIPDIFKAMTHSDDSAIMHEFYQFALQLHAKGKLTEAEMFKYLLAKVPSSRVKMFFELAVDANIIKRVGYNKYVPGDVLEHKI